MMTEPEPTPTHHHHHPPTLLFSSQSNPLPHNHLFKHLIQHHQHYEVHNFTTLLQETYTNQKRRRSRRTLLDTNTNNTTLQFNIFNQHFIFNLTLVNNLYSKQYQHSYLDENDTVIQTEQPIQNCLYQGQHHHYLASITLCDDNEERIFVQAYHRRQTNLPSFSIEPIMVHQQPLHLVYYLPSNTNNNSFPLLLTVPTFNTTTTTNQRQLLSTNILNKDSPIKYVNMLIVNDHAMYEKYKSDIHIHTLHMFLSMMTYYDTLQALYPQAKYFIQLKLKYMVTFAVKDVLPVPSRISSNDLIYAFSRWTSSNRKRFGTDANLLVTGIPLQENIVGLAYVKSICARDHAYNSAFIYGIHNLDGINAVIGAHEIAHILGAQHDDWVVPMYDDGNNTFVLSGGKSCMKDFQHTIMGDGNSNSNNNNNNAKQQQLLRQQGRRRHRSLQYFSSCTMEWFRLNFDPNIPNHNYNTLAFPPCLEEEEDPPPLTSLLEDDDGNNNNNGEQQTITNNQELLLIPICGNGLKEENEQCDCVGNNCDGIDPCCNGLTCQFISPLATCSMYDECCNSTSCTPISIRNNNTIECRPSQGECDIVEYCDGIHSYCNPIDGKKNMGEMCQVIGICVGDSDTCWNDYGLGIALIQVLLFVGIIWGGTSIHRGRHRNHHNNTKKKLNKLLDGIIIIKQNVDGRKWDEGIV
jgi:hypothetical protein